MPEEYTQQYTIGTQGYIQGVMGAHDNQPSMLGCCMLLQGQKDADDASDD
jgi:hypothetical protein